MSRFQKLASGTSGRRSRAKRFGNFSTLQFEVLESRLALTGVVINEFLVQNTSGLMDEDGDRTDWIELKNTTAAPIDLAGYHLTDDPADLDKWTFPAVSIPAGGYLVVFASDKDRTVVGQNLHTNFALNEAGESLILVGPDGTTIEDAFDPFPEQLANISYGRGGQVPIDENVIGDAGQFKYLVPDAGTSATWYATGFNDASWSSGVGGVGFDNGSVYLPYFATDVKSVMDDVNASIYLRYSFPIVNPDDVTSLTFRVRYDDGFAIYLNGTAIPPVDGQRNSPALLTWDSGATESHPDDEAIVYEDIDISAYKDWLVSGNNVLAVQAMNRDAFNNDFLFAPLLVATRASESATGYMVTPTPNAANQEGTLGFVADTNFSIDRGFFTTPFTVEITTATPGAVIRYSADGSVPTATTGTVYNPASPPLISTTTTLRAAAFKTGFTPTNVDTQTYIFLDDVIQQTGAGLPPFAAWGENGPDWEMDPAVVSNPTYAATIKDDLQAIATVSLVMPWDDWFGGGGQGIYPTQAEIERAVSMEFFTADGLEKFQIDAGIEIQGGTSDDRWKMDKLSMRVKFTDPYGPEKFDGNIYNDNVLDQGAAISFNTFVLDAHLGYTWAYGGPAGSTQRVNAMFVQDAYVADLHNLADGASPHSRFVHLYINGLYWGVYDMHERSDEHFAESYLGGNDDDYDVIKHRTTTEVNGIDLNPDPNVYQSSAITNYAAMLNLARQNMTVQANYDALAAKLDIDDFISYMVINYYVGNTDWAHQNWYASFNRVDPNGKWRYHSWDAENVLKSVNENVLNRNDTGGPTEVFNRLIVNPEFRLRFNDVVQKLMRNDGLLTPAQAASVYQTRADGLGGALVGESARWGDSRTVSHSFGPPPNDPVGIGNPYLLSHWIDRNNDLYTNYFPLRTGVVLNQFAAKTWSTTLGAPTFTNYGGTVALGTLVTISKPAGSPAAGVLYYTLDGSDPRDVGGGVAAGAIQAPSGSTILTISAGTRVRARVFDVNQSGTNNDWSAEIDATFLVDTPFPLRITELHYQPAALAGVPDASNQLEFIELTNTGIGPISLDGVQIAGFADSPYVLPAGLSLAAGERMVVARNPSVLQSVYGTEFQVAPVGYANANLSNGGELVTLLGPFGETLQSFTFDDAAPWPTSPDGGGRSLVIVDPLGDPSDATNWRASYYDGGSPGRDDLPIPGDYLTDGVVDAADYSAWKSAYGNVALAGHGADGNGDGGVDALDYTVWRNNVGSAYTFPAVGGGGALSLAVASTNDSQPTQSFEASGGAPVELAFYDFGSVRGANRVGSRSWDSQESRPTAFAPDKLLLVTRLGPPASIADVAERELRLLETESDPQCVNSLDGPLDKALADLFKDRWIVD
jgi:hypothetical protein